MGTSGDKHQNEASGPFPASIALFLLQFNLKNLQDCIFFFFSLMHFKITRQPFIERQLDFHLSVPCLGLVN